MLDGVRKCRMRREAAPHDVPGQTYLVEQLRRVACNPPRQHVALPVCRRDLVPLQLLDDLKCARDAVKLGARRQMLPGKQESQEIRGRDRRNFLTQAAERETVDASEQTAIAPLDLCVWSCGCPCEPAAQDLAFRLEP